MRSGHTQGQPVRGGGGSAAPPWAGPCCRCHSGSQAGVRNEDGLEEHTQDEGKALEAEALVQKR